MPKATLLRILKTLQQAGWVERNDLEGRYFPTSAAGESGPAVEWRAQLSSLAAQPRATLQRRVPWPTDLGVRDGTAMLILDSHRPINGLAVNYRVLGFRPPMLMSSLGRCYLSFCPDNERKDILEALARSPSDVDRLARSPHSIRRMVAHAREQGYAARDPAPTSIDSPERFGAISVPVRCADHVIACLSCSWLPAIASEREVVVAHLTDLQAAARAIEEKVRQAGLKLFGACGAEQPARRSSADVDAQVCGSTCASWKPQKRQPSTPDQIAGVTVRTVSSAGLAAASVRDHGNTEVSSLVRASISSIRLRLPCSRFW
ncbi:MAG: hypothetical protein NVSMB34_14140 [Variovorax sp.]